MTHPSYDERGLRMGLTIRRGRSRGRVGFVGRRDSSVGVVVVVVLYHSRPRSPPHCQAQAPFHLDLTHDWQRSYYFPQTD